MVSKITILCFSAFFFQAIAGQCIGNPGAGYGLAGNGFLAGNGLGNGCANGFNGPNPGLTTGGTFQVTSSSPFAPTGIQILTELAIEGPLSVVGTLPLLGAVALEGAIPTGGQAGVSYGCGNGNVGIVSEIGNGANAGLANGGLANPGLANPGYGPGAPGYNINGAGLGCNRIM